CNGYKELCQRSYGKVSTAVTHNSFALTPSPAGNQNKPIVNQLQDGIRGLMLDLHISTKSSNAVELCHGDCGFLDAGPLLDTLVAIKDFLDTNPFEVITLFLENFAQVDGDAIKKVFESSGLLRFAKAQKVDEEWPTLEEMIRNNTRLVVFIDRSVAPKWPWLLEEYDFLWETTYTIPVNSSYNCDVDRPKESNSAMYLINHFVFTQLNIGESNINIPAASHATLTNGEQLQNHAIQCREERNRTANFLAVDFYDVGNILQVVAELNGVTY
ncbi:PLC-like phosphodiesterase, partial [Basidiobolus meristosporus CBS 931.73]